MEIAIVTGASSGKGRNLCTANRPSAKDWMKSGLLRAGGAAGRMKTIPVCPCGFLHMI